MNSADRVQQMVDTAREQIARSIEARQDREIEQGILAAMVADRDKNVEAVHGS